VKKALNRVLNGSLELGIRCTGGAYTKTSETLVCGQYRGTMYTVLQREFEKLFSDCRYLVAFPEIFAIEIYIVV